MAHRTLAWEREFFTGAGHNHRLAPPELHMITESFLAHAATVFFASWSLIIFSISIAAFASDLLPSKVRLHPAAKPSGSPSHPSHR